MTTGSNTSSRDLAVRSSSPINTGEANDVLSHPIWVIGVLALSVVAVFAWIGLIGWALAVALIWLI